MTRYFKLLALLMSVLLFVVACGGETPAEPTPAPAEEAPAPAPAPVEEAPAPAEPVATGDAVFFSTQFVPVEEQEAFRTFWPKVASTVTGTKKAP
jgi:multiple sugar transport system substrate-binding protein